MAGIVEAASIAAPPPPRVGIEIYAVRRAPHPGLRPSGGGEADDFRPGRPLPQGALGARGIYASATRGVNRPVRVLPPASATSMLFLPLERLSNTAQAETAPPGVTEHTKFRRLLELARTQLGEVARGDPVEDFEGPVEVPALVGRHEARPKEGAAPRHGGVDRDVRVEAGVEEGLPQEHRPPVLPDDDRDDRARRLRAVWKHPRLDDAKPELAKAAPQVASVVEELRHQRRPFAADHTQRPERRAHGRRHRRGAEDERARRDPQVLDH